MKKNYTYPQTDTVPFISEHPNMALAGSGDHGTSAPARKTKDNAPL